MFSNLKDTVRSFVGGILFLALGASTVAYGQSWYDYGYDRERQHERAEKHALKHHQEAERYEYGDSYALHQHQREERRRLKQEQRYERHTGERIHGYGDRYDDRYRDRYDDRYRYNDDYRR